MLFVLRFDRLYCEKEKSRAVSCGEDAVSWIKSFKATPRNLLAFFNKSIQLEFESRVMTRRPNGYSSREYTLCCLLLEYTFFIAGLFAVLFACPDVRAVPDESRRPSTIDIFGLSLPCEKCTVRGDGKCIVPVNGEPVLSSCEKACARILKDLLDSGYDGQHPAPREIRNCLFEYQLDGQTNRALIELLFRTEEGSRIFEKEVNRFVEFYASQLIAFIRERRGEKALWHILWKTSGLEEMPEGPELRLLAAERHPDISLKDVLSETSVSDIEKAVGEVEVSERILRQLKSPWVEDVQRCLEVMRSCALIVESGEIPEACSVQRLHYLPKEISVYLYRVQVQSVLAHIEKHDLDPIEVLEKLQGINYVQYRTPDTHRVLISALDNILAYGSTEILEKSVSAANIEMLETFSENDEEIAKRMREILSRIGDDFVQKNTMITHWPLIVGLVFACIAAGIGYRICRGRKTQARGGCDSECFDGLTEFDAAELKGLLRFFGLPRTTTEEELTAAYRKRAKGSHPDLFPGNDMRFFELTEKYNRAKQLLGQK